MKKNLLRGWGKSKAYEVQQEEGVKIGNFLAYGRSLHNLQLLNINFELNDQFELGVGGGCFSVCSN